MLKAFTGIFFSFVLRSPFLCHSTEWTLIKLFVSVAMPILSLPTYLYLFISIIQSIHFHELFTNDDQFIELFPLITKFNYNINLNIWFELFFFGGIKRSLIQAMSLGSSIYNTLTYFSTDYHCQMKMRCFALAMQTIINVYLFLVCHWYIVGFLDLINIWTNVWLFEERIIISLILLHCPELMSTGCQLAHAKRWTSTISN